MVFMLLNGWAKKLKEYFVTGEISIYLHFVNAVMQHQQSLESIRSTAPKILSCTHLTEKCLPSTACDGRSG